VAHAHGTGLALGVEPSVGGRTVRDEGTAPFPPGPDDRDGWRAYLGRFPDVKPAIRRRDDGVPNRVDQLRAMGNAVCPPQARLAWEVLMQRMTAGEGRAR
jgi:hypothetical protein